MSKTKDRIVEYYTIEPEVGAVALFTRVQRDGYKVLGIARKGTKVSVFYQRIK